LILHTTTINFCDTFCFIKIHVTILLDLTKYDTKLKLRRVMILFIFNCWFHSVHSFFMIIRALIASLLQSIIFDIIFYYFLFVIYHYPLPPPYFWNKTSQIINENFPIFWVWLFNSVPPNKTEVIIYVIFEGHLSQGFQTFFLTLTICQSADLVYITCLLLSQGVWLGLSVSLYFPRLEQIFLGLSKVQVLQMNELQLQKETCWT
jgi:hypothetical protein